MTALQTVVFRRAQRTDLEQLAKMRWAYRVEDGSDPAKQSQSEFVKSFGLTSTDRFG